MTQWQSSDVTEVIPAVGSDPVPDTIAAPDPSAAAQAPPDRENVTCPECGAPAVVTLNRRQAEDFCRHCDYPLFWTPSLVVLDHGGLGEDSLRRLPGTTGRAMTASVACPHCAEPHPITAVNCVRCGLSMTVQAPPPPPAPVYVAPPPSPYYWWPPISIGLGFSWGHWSGGGCCHGGWHGGHGGWHGGHGGGPGHR